MDKAIEDIIKKDARALAKKHNITDIEKVTSIMRKIARDCSTVRYHETQKDQLLEDFLAFIPLLDEALTLFPLDKVMNIFEDNMVYGLWIKNTALQICFSKQNPFYTHQELLDLIIKFIEYLYDNKTSLISTGYPTTVFESSFWLYYKLARLYPVRIPASIQNRRFIYQKDAKTDDTTEKNAEIDAFVVRPVPEARKYHLTPFDLQKQRSYEDTPLLYSLTDKEVEKIEEQRATLFHLKRRILEIAYRNIINKMTPKKNYAHFCNECINAISDKLSRQDFQFFTSIEKKYADLSSLYQFSADSPTMVANPITDFNREMDSGGIKNLLDFVYFVERQLKLDSIYTIKTKIKGLIKNQTPPSYFQLVSSREITEIDKFLGRSLADYYGEKEFHETFCKMLKSSIEKELKIPLLIIPERYDAIKAYAELLETHCKIGIDVRGRFAVPLPYRKEIYPLELAAGTR